jgi:acetyl-CoA C-acetyltransferase
MGNVISANLGQAPARQATILGGLPKATVTTTVNKVCASGMKTIMLASQDILLNQADVIVAGGMESMSNVPYYVDARARFGGFKYGHSQFTDGILRDGLTDVYDNIHMGVCAEHCAKTFNFSRQEQDNYAVSSYTRGAEATKAGLFKPEIVPFELPAKKGAKEPTFFTEDEEFKKVNFDKIPTLKPAFDKAGSVTAANSSALNDGASAVVVSSLEAAEKHGMKPLARIIGWADAERAPIEFTIAPALAIPKALARAGIKVEDVDFWEINEAFAVVSLANMKLLNIPHEKINVRGGAIALGHPIGSSGCRITVSLAHLLQQTGKRYGVAAICNGGGGASAVVIERM